GRSTIQLDDRVEVRDVAGLVIDHESLSFFHLHGHREPDRAPARRRPRPRLRNEAIGSRTRRRTTTRTNGRFMESAGAIFGAHWHHEPADRAAASWTAPVLWRFRSARLHCQSARRLAQSKTWRGLRRSMESLLSFFACLGTMNPPLVV